MLFMFPVFKRIPCLMNFDLSHSIEVLTVTPPTLRSLLGNVSEHWTNSNSDLGFGLLDFQRTGSAESDKSSEVRNPKSEIPDRQWSPFDVLGHLIHGEKTDWIPRAKIILEQGDDLTFVPFDRFAQFENSTGKSLPTLLDDFAQLRTQNIATLREWKLTDVQLDLKGTHPELGTVTLRQLIATWVVHDLNHIRQIVAAMAKRYGEDVGPWKQYLSILS